MIVCYVMYVCCVSDVCMYVMSEIYVCITCMYARYVCTDVGMLFYYVCR